MKKENIIKINELNKWYGDFHELKNINLNIKEGINFLLTRLGGLDKQLQGL